MIPYVTALFLDVTASVATITTENVSAAFGHPISVAHEDGRWAARALSSRTIGR